MEAGSAAAEAAVLNRETNTQTKNTFKRIDASYLRAPRGTYSSTLGVCREYGRVRHGG